MNVTEIWNATDLKLIAILRGIRPDETKAIVEVLIKVGFRAIEIPLNSPQAFQSIEIAMQTANAMCDEPCLIGAGTVLTVEDVERVKQAGGNLIVSPNVDQAVIAATKEHAMFSAPGVLTPSECISALKHGADVLKIFPASGVGPSGIKALKAVLPTGTQICAVGGVGDDDFDTYVKAGAVGFGLGSSLYSPGLTPDEIKAKSVKTVAAFKAGRISA